jgi:hypothetical protein
LIARLAWNAMGKCDSRLAREADVIAFADVTGRQSLRQNDADGQSRNHR